MRLFLSYQTASLLSASIKYRPFPYLLIHRTLLSLMSPISIASAPENSVIPTKATVTVTDPDLSADGISTTIYQAVPVEQLEAAFSAYVDLTAKTRGDQVLVLSDKSIVVELGYPGSIAGFEVDTSSLTGNHSPIVSVEGLVASTIAPKDMLSSEVESECEGKLEESHRPSSTEKWASQPWASVLPEVSLNPNSRQGFKLEKLTSVNYTHIRFRLCSENASLSRPRVYGAVQRFYPEDKYEVFDLAAAATGSTVADYSGDHSGHPSNLLLLGRGRHTSDGWEIKRSSSESHDEWCQIKLGTPGHPALIEVDTAHYKSTSATAVTVHGFTESDTLRENPIVLLADAAIKPHRQNFFNIPSEISAGSLISSLRVIIPDGGIQRVRVFGSQSWPAALIHKDSPIGRRQPLEDEHTWNLNTLLAEPITTEAFAPWGQVIEIPSNDPNSILINRGTAQKFSNVGEFVNWRSYATENHPALPDRTNPGIPPAKANIAVLHCNSPLMTSKMDVKMVERHPHSSQMFVPLGGDDTGGFVVVVAKDKADGNPDVSSLRAFTVKHGQGINYKPNVWHHPMVITGQPMTFLTITHESGVAKDDCEVYWFQKETDDEEESATTIVCLA